MKILIISNMYPSKQKPYSGIFVKNQYEYLKNELNQNVDIYIMKRSYTNKLGSIVKYCNFYFSFFSFIFKKYDILHIHFFGFHIYLSVLYKIFHPSCKILVTLHGSDTKNINKHFFRLSLKFIDKFIAVGNEQGKYIKKYIEDQRVKILSAGIDEKTFFQDKSINKVYDFIFVGSFYDIKGIDIFIETIKKLDRKDIKYYFVGSGKYQNDIEQLSNKYDITIKNNQSQNEIRALLNQSRWLVLPSRGDSFGLVVSEAIFCGTPAIVSNIGGMKDQIKDGINGYILKENTPENLAQKIDEVMKIESSQYDTLKNNTISTNKKYSMSSVCNTLLNIYKDLINEK